MGEGSLTSRVGEVWEHKSGSITLLVVGKRPSKVNDHAWEALTLHDPGVPKNEGTTRLYAEEFFTEQEGWWERIA